MKCIRCARQMRQTNENKTTSLMCASLNIDPVIFHKRKCHEANLCLQYQYCLDHCSIQITKRKTAKTDRVFFGPVLLFLFDENFKGGSAIGLKLLLISNIQLVNESLIQDWLDSNRKSKFANWKNAKKRKEKKNEIKTPISQSPCQIGLNDLINLTLANYTNL